MKIWVLAVLSAAVLAGCAKPQPFVSDDRYERGLVIVLPGIEGRSKLNEAICQGLDDGGVNYAVELSDWTSAYGPLMNLRSESRNRQKAADIADRIVRYRISYPNRPVFLIGQSGGGAIAVWTMESLPPGHYVEGAILMAASLSPEYMLDHALINSRRGIVNFYSTRDVVLLGLGTTIAGTMDGEHTSSAGRTGFTIPDAGGRPRVYKNLYQIAWNEKMSRSGNLGMHLTSGAEEFVAEYIAPLMRAPHWDTALMAQIQNEEYPAAVVPGAIAQPAPPSQAPQAHRTSPSPPQASVPSPSRYSSPSPTPAPATQPAQANPPAFRWPELPSDRPDAPLAPLSPD
jgi:pimeloyl-ACP methyl ester carboxylesterase